MSRTMILFEFTSASTSFRVALKAPDEWPRLANLAVRVRHPSHDISYERDIILRRDDLERLIDYLEDRLTHVPTDDVVSEAKWALEEFSPLSNPFGLTLCPSWDEGSCEVFLSYWTSWMEWPSDTTLELAPGDTTEAGLMMEVGIVVDRADIERAAEMARRAWSAAQ